MSKIENLLYRRTDLSTFLVHLTKASDSHSSKENLQSILEDQRVEGRTAMGIAKAHDSQLKESPKTQRVVCVTETPLEHIWMMLEEIDGRQVVFEPYGVAITKTAGRRRGFNPVWYTDMTPGHDWLCPAADALVADAVARANASGEPLSEEAIFRITPFIEQMGPTNSGGHKEFWWEREWRKAGDFNLLPSYVVAVLAPEEDHDDLRDVMKDLPMTWSQRPLLDPRWGLERMICELAGVDADDIGPFPA